jgi:GlpG protein|tara:strand:+ start:2747 stop:3649 length:903 start_codon:yes stop_codon:yes gene_type:complete
MMLLQSFPGSTDLTPITQALWQHKMPHRVRFINGEQQLWLHNAAQHDAAQELLQAMLKQQPGEDAWSEPLPPASKSTFTANHSAGSASLTWTNAKTWFSLTPITIGMLLFTLVVTLLSRLGTQLEIVAWLSFFPLVLDTQAYLVGGFEHLWQQPWRLISPILLHFGWLHMVFNLLWWLDLGRRIEHQSKSLLVALLLVTSIAGNVAQAWQEASLFGGFSGVIYGLLGYIWVMDRYNAPRYHLPQNILLFMLIWLLLGISGLFAALGFGAMANLAHLGGLLAGVGWGFLHTFLYRIESNKR